MNQLRIAIVGLALVAGLAFSACGGEAEDAKPAKGVVLGIDKENAKITLDHGDIPGLMDAMTMTYSVSDAELLEGVNKGDTVAFRLRYADETYTVTAISTQ